MLSLCFCILFGFGPHWFGANGAAAAMAAPVALDQSPASGTDVVRVTVLPARTHVAPGTVVPIAILLDHQHQGNRHWYTQAGGPDADPDSIPTTVNVTALDERLHVRRDAIQWPEAEQKSLDWAGGASIAVYGGRAIIYVPVEIRPDAASGAVSLTVSVGYQACDDRVCLPPVTGQGSTVQLAITTNPGDGAIQYPEIFEAFRPILPVLEPVSPALGGSLVIHLIGGVLVVIAAAIAAGAGMISPGNVLLIRALAAGAGVLTVLIWLGVTLRPGS